MPKGNRIVDVLSHSIRNCPSSGRIPNNYTLPNLFFIDPKTNDFSTTSGHTRHPSLLDHPTQKNHRIVINLKGRTCCNRGEGGRKKEICSQEAEKMNDLSYLILHFLMQHSISNQSGSVVLVPGEGRTVQIESDILVEVVGIRNRRLGIPLVAEQRILLIGQVPYLPIHCCYTPHEFLKAGIVTLLVLDRLASRITTLSQRLNKNTTTFCS